MSKLTWPSYDTAQATIQAMYQAERPNADATRYSDLWLYSRILARLVSRVHKTVDRALDAIFPATTFGVYLGWWLKWVGAPDGQGGYGLITARAATADGETTVTGTTGNSISIGDILTDTAGRSYQINEDYTFPSDGDYDADIIAIDTGIGTNRAVGDVLTFSSPPGGITAATTVVTALTGGVDDETDEEGRARLLFRLQYPPASGNWADWIITIEDVSPGAIRGYCWPGRENQPTGYGCIDYAAAQIGVSGTARFIASGTVLYDAIDTAVADNLPALLVRSSRQLTMTEGAQGVELTITLSTGAAESDRCDWDAEQIKPTVASHDAGGPQIIASANVKGYGDGRDMVAGDRVVIKGLEATVATVGVGGTTKFTVASWPWDTGAAALNGSNITSGGGWIGNLQNADGDANSGVGIQRAMQDLFDSMGPAKGVAPDVYAAPRADWEDTIRPQAIQSTIIALGDGVIIDVEVTTPAKALPPTAGSDATTEFRTLGVATIWEAK